MHCQDAERCRENGVHEMPGFEMVATVPTWYCHDLVTAMAELLRSALAIRAEVPHPSSREKFVFLSDSTLPTKPFGVVHDALMSDEDSDFCVFPKDQWASATLDDREMLRTFNCGVGMVLIVKRGSVEEAKRLLREAGEEVVYDLGELVERQGNEEQVEMKADLS